jgi:hypothetical protein
MESVTEEEEMLMRISRFERVLTMVYNARFLGFARRPILKTSLKNTTFRKLDLFPYSDEREGHLHCWVRWKKLTSITGRLVSVFSAF